MDIASAMQLVRQNNFSSAQSVVSNNTSTSMAPSAINYPSSHGRMTNDNPDTGTHNLFQSTIQPLLSRSRSRSRRNGVPEQVLMEKLRRYDQLKCQRSRN